MFNLHALLGKIQAAAFREVRFMIIKDEVRRHVLRDWQRGERVPLLARRYQLDPADIRRLLAEGERHT